MRILHIASVRSCDTRARRYCYTSISVYVRSLDAPVAMRCYIAI